MIYFEPKWSLLDSTSAPREGVISSTTRIGSDGSDKVYDTAVRFCNYLDKNYETSYLGSSNVTIAYFKPTTNQFETKAQVPFVQIECSESAETVEPIVVALDLPNATTTENFEITATVGILFVIALGLGSIMFHLVKKVT